MAGMFLGFCQDWDPVAPSPVELYKRSGRTCQLCNPSIIRRINKDKYIILGHGHTLKHRHVTTPKTPALTHTPLSMQSFLKRKQDLQANKQKIDFFGKIFFP